MEAKVSLADVEDGDPDEDGNPTGDVSSVGGTSNDEDDDSDGEPMDSPPKASTCSTKASSKASGVTKTSQGAATATRSTAASRRTQTANFMGAIATSLDPALRDARDETRYARKFAQAEIEALRQDNRDLRARNDALQDRILQLTMQLQQQSAELAHLRTRLEMHELLRSSGSRGRHDKYSPRTPRRRRRSHSVVSPRTPRYRYDNSRSPSLRSPRPRASGHSQPAPAAASGLDALASVASTSSHL